MQNTGTWNSDLAIIFFFCLMFPIAGYFFAGMMAAIPRRPVIKETRKKKKSKKKNESPYSFQISFDMPDFWGKSGEESSKTKRAEPKPQKKKQASRPEKEHSGTDDTVIKEAVSGLVNLGYKKTDASKLVKSIISKKSYDSAESLVEACFVCIS